MSDLSLTEQAFSIPLIIINILKNLDTEDLLRTSFLNKHWNFFSRKILRKTKKCLTKVEREGRSSCHYLKNLNDLLLTSEEVPFSGISLAVTRNVCGRDRLCPTSTHKCVITAADRSETVSNILSKINIKYLDLSFLGYGPSSSDCATLECIRKIILEQAMSLEGLCMYEANYFSKGTFSELIGLELPRGQWLPNIRILELELPYDYVRRFEPVRDSRMIWELVEASPKLEALFGFIEVYHLKFILPLKKVRAVKDFFFRPTIEYICHCEAFSRENPKLRKIFFSTSSSGRAFHRWEKPVQNKICRILMELLNSSEDSLNKIGFDHPDLLLITSKWIILPTLKNVTQMFLRYYFGFDEAAGWCTLKNIEWAKHFPNLKEVYAMDKFRDSGSIETDFYTDDSFVESNAQFVCETVTKLSWVSTYDYACPWIIQMMAKVFPNVKEFYLARDKKISEFLDPLWTAWPTLEILALSIEIELLDWNYDPVFLGLTNEEAYLLNYIEKDLEFESLEIVSIKPCIFNLRNLKKFVVNFIHNKTFCLYKVDEAVVLSRLAGQCVFSRIPGLMVEIYRELCKTLPPTNCPCHFTFNHLKPVAKCVEGQYDDFEASF